MKNIGLIIGCCVLLACKEPVVQKAAQSETIQNQEKPMKYLPVTIEALKRKSLKVAMDEYGAPLHVETFILDDALPESRIELLNHFSKEERQKASITLKETVWEKDNKTNITAWYREKDRQWVLVHAMEWKKGSEF